MIRLFERYQRRKVLVLDGIWKFKIDPVKKGVEEKWAENFPDDAVDIPVPSCWNNELGYYDYEGTAWYATQFFSTATNLNLVFHGVSGQTEIYFDGKPLGSHYGGYTGFEFTVQNVSPGMHTVVVCTDNSHNDIDTIPLSKVDWFHYGGITRSVEVMELDTVWIKDYRIDYKLEDDLKKACLKFDVLFESFDKNSTKRELKIYLNKQIIVQQWVEIQGQARMIIDNISLENIELWDMEHPNLYSVKFEIDEDDITERIGFREIKMKDRKIYLNGKKIFLKGVNRHEDHPEWGHSLPFKLMKRDMDILKDMGCNAIRGAHYPNNPLFLDYCDSEGMLFWEEVPLWQHLEKHMENPLCVERGLKMLDEMVNRDLHHPCIIMWGLHNEINTTIPQAYEMTKQYADKVRSLDTSRAVTHASSRRQADICFDLSDIVCINYYIGWYTNMGPLKDWPEFLKDMKDKLAKDHLAHLPLVISEFGAAAMKGVTSFEGQKWTENYQEKYLDYTLNLFLTDEDISGVFIWQYSDIRSSKDKEMLRPRCFNNKGILSEYRQPKMAYWKVKELYTRR